MGLSAVGAGALATAFALQLPGPFHAGTPGARDGDTWLALRTDASGAALVTTAVRVRPLFEDGPGGRRDAAGFEVDSPVGQASTVVAYLRGPALRPGPVATARATVYEAATHRAKQSFSLGARHYGLAVRCPSRPTAIIEGQAQYRCPLVLAQGRATQQLGELQGFHEAPSTTPQFEGAFSVLFAGDLDLDGRLDLVLELSAGGHATRTVLLLSSQARGAAIVGEAAAQHVAGC